MMIKNMTHFDSKTFYEFEKMENGKVYPYRLLSDEGKSLLSEVITYAKSSLFSRFSDFVYDQDEHPRYKWMFGALAGLRHKTMVKTYALTKADLAEYMEDMICKGNFVGTRRYKKKPAKDGNTVFIFRDMLCFDRNAAPVPVELQFSLELITKGKYMMRIHEFSQYRENIEYHADILLAG